jgi:hypothetical protein
MRPHLILVVWTLICSCAICDESEQHDWASDVGTTVRAALVGFTTAKEPDRVQVDVSVFAQVIDVVLDKGAGKHLRIPIARLSPESRELAKDLNTARRKATAEKRDEFEAKWRAENEKLHFADASRYHTWRDLHGNEMIGRFVALDESGSPITVGASRRTSKKKGRLYDPAAEMASGKVSGAIVILRRDDKKVQVIVEPESYELAKKIHSYRIEAAKTDEERERDKRNAELLVSVTRYVNAIKDRKRIAALGQVIAFIALYREAASRGDNARMEELVNRLKSPELSSAGEELFRSTDLAKCTLTIDGRETTYADLWHQANGRLAARIKVYPAVVVKTDSDRKREEQNRGRVVTVVRYANTIDDPGWQFGFENACSFFLQYAEATKRGDSVELKKQAHDVLDSPLKGEICRAVEDLIANSEFEEIEVVVKEKVLTFADLWKDANRRLLIK